MKTMNERKIVMTDKSRERNYVDLFSDYGMDEGQIAIQNKILFQRNKQRAEIFPALCLLFYWE